MPGTCERRNGRPHAGSRTWLRTPPPPGVPGIGGLGEEPGLDVELPAALASLGSGWFESGLVERAYAEALGTLSADGEIALPALRALTR